MYKSSYNEDITRTMQDRSDMYMDRSKMEQKRSGIYMDRMDGKLPKDRVGMHYDSTDKK